MTDGAVFSIEVETELHDEFVAELQAADRPAAEVMQELMRAFVERQREKREYKAFLQAKVDRAMESVRAGRGRSNEEVSRAFAAKRAVLAARLAG